MSIATALTDLSGRIQDAYTALSAKGATMPSVKNSANLSATIDTLGSGGTDYLALLLNNTSLDPLSSYESNEVTSIRTYSFYLSQFLRNISLPNA